LVYHVLNRSVAGLPLFRKEKDYEAFERIMVEAQERHPTRRETKSDSRRLADRAADELDKMGE
jgi:hypothetical protein